MRHPTAYFVGAGTVTAAITAGLGGGFVDLKHRQPATAQTGSSEVTRLERRMSPQPIPANGKLEPVPYLAAPQV